MPKRKDPPGVLGYRLFVKQDRRRKFWRWGVFLTDHNRWGYSQCLYRSNSREAALTWAKRLVDLLTPIAMVANPKTPLRTIWIAADKLIKEDAA